jgi:diguanylate cyclase (GGDEF)-like protein
MSVPAVFQPWPRLRPRGTVPAWTAVAFAAAVIGVPLVVLLAGGTLGPLGRVYRRDLTSACYLVAFAIAAARPLVVRRDRLPWVLLAAGIGAYTVGHLQWTYWLPFPAVSDAFWLAAYPLLFAGLALLARRPRAGSSRVVLDAVAGGAGLASLVAAVAFGKVVDGTAGLHGLGLATDLAYPILDLVLLALVVGTLAVDGWRIDLGRLPLLTGAALLAAVDTSNSVQNAAGLTAVSTVAEGAYALAFLAIAATPWLPLGARTPRLDGMTTLVPPIAASGCAVGVLVYGNTTPIEPLAIVLATVALVAALGRTATGYRTMAELARSRHEALTDDLTGLANRRMLFRSLEETLADGRPAVLALLDLDGFKAYNDAHGHLEGDRLLARLGRVMAAAAGSTGRAFRLGGDEFCVVLEGHGRVDTVLARIEAAAARAGDDGRLGISWGSVLLPDEAADADAAVRLADARMYAVKGERASSVRR